MNVVMASSSVIFLGLDYRFQLRSLRSQPNILPGNQPGYCAALPAGHCAICDLLHRRFLPGASARIQAPGCGRHHSLEQSVSSTRDTSFLVASELQLPTYLFIPEVKSQAICANELPCSKLTGIETTSVRLGERIQKKKKPLNLRSAAG